MRAGDEALARVTGAREPSGVPVTIVARAGPAARQHAPPVAGHRSAAPGRRTARRAAPADRVAPVPSDLLRVDRPFRWQTIRSASAVGGRSDRSAPAGPTSESVISLRSVGWPTASWLVAARLTDGGKSGGGPGRGRGDHGGRSRLGRTRELDPGGRGRAAGLLLAMVAAFAPWHATPAVTLPPVWWSCRSPRRPGPRARRPHTWAEQRPAYRSPAEG